MGDFEKRLWEKLIANRDRLQRLADEEARHAFFGGSAVAGKNTAGIERLMAEAEKSLHDLEKLVMRARP
ncbi:MAG TPA: hypothetical protein VHN20_00025 [Beijerinckiaceae bacterium]|nr:hypothetical protein [Beijerinckiaceae bacterium]